MRARRLPLEGEDELGSLVKQYDVAADHHVRSIGWRWRQQLFCPLRTRLGALI
jgi:hypothetical protein